MADTERAASPARGRSPSPARARSPSPSRRARSPSPAKAGGGADAANPGTNLYVAGLSLRTSAGELERKFAKYGKVTECHLVIDPRTKDSRGFGFVTMETVEAAEDAIRGMNRADVDGRQISVEKAKRGRPRTPTRGVYMGARRRDERDRYSGRDRDRDRDYRRDDRRDRRSPPRDSYRRDRSRSPPRDSYRRDRSPRGYDSRY